MLYTPSHAELGQHPKTRKLARLLGVSVPTTLGHLHLLWHFTLKYAPDGDLSRFDADEIADGCLWEGDGLAFVRALFAAGWTEYPVEGAGPCIHDWEEHGGKYVQRKEANAQRMRDARAHPKQDTKQPRATHVQRTTAARVEPEKRREEKKRVEEIREEEKDASHEALAATGAPRTAAKEPTPLINPLWDALVSGIGIAPKSGDERSRYGKAVKALKEFDATPAEVLAHCANYRAHWPSVSLTPESLLKHWSSMDHPPSPEAQRRGGRHPDPHATVTLDNGVTVAASTAAILLQSRRLKLGGE